jgi:CRP-like cAMP-binding protein
MLAQLPDWSRIISQESRKILPFHRELPDDSGEALLAKTPLFADLTVEELSQVVGIMDLETVPAGEIILAEGERSERMYLIRKGWVSTFSENLDPNTTAQNTLSAGDLLGETPFLLRDPQSCSARANSEVAYWSLTDAALTSIVTQSPVIGLKLGLALGRGIAQLQPYLSHRLVSIPLFENLAVVQRSVLTRYLTPQRYFPNETIFSVNDPPTGIFFVQRGQVWLMDQFNEINITLSAGDTFGERSVIYSRPHFYTARASKDTIVWLLSPADFSRLGARYPSVAATIEHNVTTAVADDLSMAMSVITAEVDALRSITGTNHPLLKNMETVRRSLSWIRRLHNLDGYDSF